MCTPNDDGVGMMKRREGWDKKLHELFLNDNEMQYVSKEDIVEIAMEPVSRLHMNHCTRVILVNYN